MIVKDSRDRLPEVVKRGTSKLADGPDAAAAYDLTIALLDQTVGAGREVIVAVEAFTHRGYIVRRIDTAPRMGAVVAGITLGARATHIPVYEIQAGDHKNRIPRGLYPPSLRNRHERDAYSLALAAIGEHRIARQDGSA